MKTHVKSRWSHAVLVCRKCQKKIKGGFGPAGKDRLSKALQEELSAKKGRKSHIGVVESGCFDVCPKNAVILVDSRTPGLWRLVQKDADISALARELSADQA